MAPGKPELATRQMDLEFRSTTQWLAITNGLGLSGESSATTAATGPHEVAKTQWYAGKRKSTTQKIYPFAAHLTTLLVRQHEVVAVALLETNDVLMDAMRRLKLTALNPVTEKGLELADVRSGFVITRNFRRDDVQLQAPPSGQTLGQIDCKIVKLTGQAFPAGTRAAKYYVDNIEMTVRQKIGDSRGRMMLRSKISFAMHADNLVCLLRRMRLALTQSELRRAFGAFKTDPPKSDTSKSDKPNSDKPKPRSSNKRNFFVALTADFPENARRLAGKHFPPPRDVKPLTPQQMKNMRHIIGFLKDRGKITGIKNYPPSTKEWYDLNGRLAFQEIFAALLKGFPDALKELVKHKRECHSKQTAYLKKPAGAQPADATVMQKQVINFNYWMALPESPLSQHYAEDSNDMDDSNDATEDIDDTELAELDEIACSRKYEVKETDSDQQIASLITSKSGFRLLETQPKYDDHEMEPLKQLLRRVKLPSGRYLSPQEQEEVMKQIASLRKDAGQSEFKFDEAVFNGTCHCETILICLQILARHRTEISPNADIPDKSITDLFLKTISVMPVSKHCCPACSSAVEYYEANIGNVMYLGGHKNWSACALPSWILKHVAEHMLEKAQKTLGIRLENLLLKRTSPSPSSSGVKSPDVELSMYTEEASLLAFTDTYSTSL
ncbi:hypothetical protein COL26b_006428 [Colletotrichum chrysophilum]|uniref:uncharacterized protein n=1 Tax=Colletotrichum chrysophilum TaxID=1836956 RepID=UPI00230025C0|nr:uncharacterized protein COL26b_006428 [Colletotrichum chrysophilum]KAJ0375372.1 hypothetical protein COL26b_006428 [Colletotrichum chrysophilum]